MSPKIGQDRTVGKGVVKEVEKQHYIEKTDGDGKAAKDNYDTEGGAWSKELGKLGFDWFKDQGHRKHGWKNVYHKEEWGDSKKYHDIFHDRDWKKKWNKWNKEKEKKQKEQIRKTVDKKKEDKQKASKSLKKEQKKKGKHAMGSHLKSDNRKLETKGDTSKKKEKKKKKAEHKGGKDGEDGDDHKSTASKHVYHQKGTGKKDGKKKKKEEGGGKTDRHFSHHPRDSRVKGAETKEKSLRYEQKLTEIIRGDAPIRQKKQRGKSVPTAVSDPRAVSNPRASPTPNRRRRPRQKLKSHDSSPGKQNTVFPSKGNSRSSSGRAEPSRSGYNQEKRNRKRSRKEKHNRKRKGWKSRSRHQKDETRGKESARSKTRGKESARSKARDEGWGKKGMKGSHFDKKRYEDDEDEETANPLKYNFIPNPPEEYHHEEQPFSSSSSDLPYPQVGGSLPLPFTPHSSPFANEQVLPQSSTSLLGAFFPSLVFR